MYMAKIYPQDLSPKAISYITSQRETFTIWMKSLVYHTNGCTVYDSGGKIVFRVDNYERKCSDEVHLMDLQGKVLYTIRKKKLQAFGGWYGYKWSDSNSTMRHENPWFEVKRHCKMFMGDLGHWQISVGCDKYKIVKLAPKLGFRIVNYHDESIVAEVKQKLSSCGVVLGNDVLSLEVEPHKDHSLIVALVIVHRLISRKM